VVHAFPSSHGFVLFTWVQPPAGLHASVVQGLPSSQLVGPPGWQVPPEQTSPVVQALPSLQDALLLVNTHPVAGLQESFVQTLLSLQVSGAPPLQVPPPQVSLVVQALPSLQELVLFVKTQPVAVLQLSVVQALLSLQTSVPCSQTLVVGLQVSVVHALPSLHWELLVHGLLMTQSDGDELGCCEG